MHVLAELGVLLLLFEIGLETDLREMFRVGPASLAVAVVGVVLPFGLGYVYWAYVPHPASGAGDLTTAAIFVGATLTATSVGITARVLSDLGRMSTPEARDHHRRRGHRRRARPGHPERRVRRRRRARP